ncbi:MAG: hypothetical protein K9M54_04130 [Kiritimatiellales bacterium]|nr:hypothetical protein [Kiritimatiellales bacterium]
MKRLIVFVFALAGVLGTGTVSAEMHEFTAKDGSVVQGEIMDYNVDTDVVSIKSDRGKTLQTKAGTFRDEDFKYIRDWDAVRLFSKNTHFRVYIDGPMSKNKWTKYTWYRGPGKREPYATWINNFNRMGYTIKFENQTGYDLENVVLKYCIYYEQERLDHAVEKKVTDLVVRPSVQLFTIVPNGINKKFESASIVLRSKEYVGGRQTLLRYLEGDGRLFRNKMIGMVFRAEIKTASGFSAVREVRQPIDLSEEYAWVEPTPENTIWPDDSLDESEDTKKPPTFWDERGGGGGSDGGGE